MPPPVLNHATLKSKVRYLLQLSHRRKSRCSQVSVSLTDFWQYGFSLLWLLESSWATLSQAQALPCKRENSWESLFLLVRTSPNASEFLTNRICISSCGFVGYDVPYPVQDSVRILASCFPSEANLGPDGLQRASELDYCSFSYGSSLNTSLTRSLPLTWFR